MGRLSPCCSCAHIWLCPSYSWAVYNTCSTNWSHYPFPADLYSMRSQLLKLWRQINTSIHRVDVCSPFQHFSVISSLTFVLCSFLVLVTSVMEQTTRIYCCKTAVIVLHSLIVGSQKGHSRDGSCLPHWGLSGGSFKYLSVEIILEASSLTCLVSGW